MKTKVYIVFLFLIVLALSACSTQKATLNTNIVDSSSSQETDKTNNTNSSKNSVDSNSGQKTDTIKTTLNTNSEDSNSNQKTDVSTSDANINTSSTKDKSSPEKAFKAVLENKISFISMDYQKYEETETKDIQEFFLNDFLNRSDFELKLERFTIIDMDGDQTPELVLELYIGDYPEEYEILHYCDGKVYGYNIWMRCFEDPREDGTFWVSNGASAGRLMKILDFNSSGVEDETIASAPSSAGDSYFINSASVTEEDYDAFWKKRKEEKKEVQWYEFSVENFEKLWSGDSLSDTLCAENEEVLFSLNIADSDKILSICTSKDSDYIVYRYGTKENIELEYPENKKGSWSKFTYSYRNNEGVDLNSLIFQNGNYKYKIYDNYNEEDSEERNVGITVTDISSGKETEIKGESSSRKGSLVDLRDNKNIKTEDYK